MANIKLKYREGRYKVGRGLDEENFQGWCAFSREDAEDVVHVMTVATVALEGSRAVQLRG